MGDRLFLMDKRKRILIAGSIALWCLSAFLAFRLYRYFQSESGVLGKSTYVTRIRKNASKFPESVYPHYYEPLPNSTESAKPPWAEEEIQYRHNADTLRADVDYPRGKQEGVFRIVAIGDSFTYGAHISVEKTFVHRLQEELGAITSRCPGVSRFEVMNLGTDGHNVQYVIERFRLHGKQYNPDLLVWLMNEHNMFSPDEENVIAQDEAKKRYTPEQLEQAITTREFFLASQKAKQDLINRYGKNNLLLRQGKALYGLSAQYTGALAMFSFADMDETVKQQIRTYAQSRLITEYHDHLPSLSSADGMLLPDLHPSERGHEYIAQSMAAFLIERGLVPCSR